MSETLVHVPQDRELTEEQIAEVLAAPWYAVNDCWIYTVLEAISITAPVLRYIDYLLPDDGITRQESIEPERKGHEGGNGAFYVQLPAGSE